MKKIVGLVIAAAATTGITVTAISRSRGGSGEGESQAALANKPAPRFVSLSSGNNKSKYSKKYGGTYGKFLVSSDSSSQEWWNHKYESIKGQLPNSQRFSGVDKGYGSDDKSLNDVCDKAYQSYSTYGEEDPNTFSKEEIWKFCSDGRTQPKSIYEYNNELPTGSTAETYDSGSEKNTFGNNQPTNASLASVLYPGNQWFWKLKGEEFFKDSKILTETGFFGEYYKSHKNDNDKAQVVKDVCASAYRQKEGYWDATDIYKWCSFAGEIDT